MLQKALFTKNVVFSTKISYFQPKIHIKTKQKLYTLGALIQCLLISSYKIWHLITFVISFITGQPQKELHLEINISVFTFVTEVWLNYACLLKFPFLIFWTAISVNPNPYISVWTNQGIEGENQIDLARKAQDTNRSKKGDNNNTL